MIIGDFGSGSGDFAQKRAFSDVGESHQSHVRDHFHFENDGMLLDLFALLGKIRRVPPRRGKAHVPLAAVAAAGDEYLLPVLEDVAD